MRICQIIAWRIKTIIKCLTNPPIFYASKKKAPQKLGFCFVSHALFSYWNHLPAAAKHPAPQRNIIDFQRRPVTGEFRKIYFLVNFPTPYRWSLPIVFVLGVTRELKRTPFFRADTWWVNFHFRPGRNRFGTLRAVYVLKMTNLRNVLATDSFASGSPETWSWAIAKIQSMLFFKTPLSSLSLALYIFNC